MVRLAKDRADLEGPLAAKMVGRLIIVTGPPGAGKSTLARELALAWPASAALHLRSDDLWTYFVKGLIPPWDPRSSAQNAVVTQAMATQAAALATTFPVFFDGIVGPWFLQAYRDAARHYEVRLDYLVLRPRREVTIAPGVARVDHPMRDADVIGRMWDQFASLGAFEPHALDTTTLSTTETLTLLLADLTSDRFQLA